MKPCNEHVELFNQDSSCVNQISSFHSNFQRLQTCLEPLIIALVKFRKNKQFFVFAMNSYTKSRLTISREHQKNAHNVDAHIVNLYAINKKKLRCTDLQRYYNAVKEMVESAFYKKQ